MKHFIYTLSDPRTKAIRYVGKTNNLAVRLSLHMCEKRGTHKNNWLHILKSIGVRPIMEVIEECSDENWAERERFWIAHFRSVGLPLTNLDSGGNHGKTQSEETKAKIRAGSIGRKMSPESIAKMKATKAARWTPERRARMGAHHKGKKHSPETIAKRSASLKGRTVSEETRKKISAAHVGMLVSEEVKAKIRFARAKQVVVNNQFTKGRNLHP